MFGNSNIIPLIIIGAITYPGWAKIELNPRNEISIEIQICLKHVSFYFSPNESTLYCFGMCKISLERVKLAYMVMESQNT